MARFTSTPEEKRLNALVAPLLAAGIIDFKEAYDVAGRCIKKATLRSWKKRELTKPCEDKEIRLIHAKIQFYKDATLQKRENEKLPATAAVANENASLHVAGENNALNFQKITPQVIENTYDYVSKLGINGLLEEIEQLQAVAVANLSVEIERIFEIEKHIDRLLLEQDSGPADIKSLLGSIEKCAELRRKITLLPYGFIDPNKQMNQQVAGPQAVHFHNHGMKGHNPNS